MPAEDLAGDDARVAAGAHQRPEADRGGDALGVGWPARPVGLLERGPDRGQHVRAGVAVRDREDVEGVDLVDVRLEVRDRGRGRPRGSPAPSQDRRGIRRRPSRWRRGRDGPGPAGSRRRRSRAAMAPGRWTMRADRGSDTRSGSRPRASAERVADRRLDLACDLGDRAARRRRSGEVDRQLGSEPRRGCRGRARPRRPSTRPTRAVAGEAGDAVGGRATAVRTRSRTARRVTSERPGGSVGHAGDVLLAGAVRASARSRPLRGRRRLCYDTTPLAPVAAGACTCPARFEGPTRPWLALAPSAARCRWAASTPSRRG